MPVRATKRGTDRTPLSGEWDVIVCGASFAGLAVARELSGSGASVLVLDRYDIGERQTSACAAPTDLLVNMGLGGAVRQTFGSLLVHTPRVSGRWPLPFTFSTFDYRHLCELLWAQCGDAVFETAKVNGRTRAVVRNGAQGVVKDETVVHTDRGDVSAPLVVDALGWRRVLSDEAAIQPPDTALSRGLEVHPSGEGTDLELWLDERYVSPGYSWSFPAGDEVRVGVGSFDPRVTVKLPTVALVGDVGRSPDGYQGNWIPHRLRTAVEDGVFFVGDSAGHCLPTTAEGIRPALIFGALCGRELRAVVGGRQDVGVALARYGAASARQRLPFEALFRVQQSIRHLHGPVLDRLTRLFTRRRVSAWAFARYLGICHPDLALPAPISSATSSRERVAVEGDGGRRLSG
ncbi:MAG: NAD(P)/FAD-dependent oxidoreductase [Solirubrobacteraceae bacterium]